MQKKENVTKHNKIPYKNPTIKWTEFLVEDVVKTSNPTEGDMTKFIEWDEVWN